MISTLQLTAWWLLRQLCAKLQRETNFGHRWGPPSPLCRCRWRCLLHPHRFHRWNKDWRRTCCSWLWDERNTTQCWTASINEILWILPSKMIPEEPWVLQATPSIMSFLDLPPSPYWGLTCVARVSAPTGWAGTAEGIPMVVAGASVAAGGCVTLALAWPGLQRNTAVTHSHSIFAVHSGGKKG